MPAQATKTRALSTFSIAVLTLAALFALLAARSAEAKRTPPSAAGKALVSGAIAARRHHIATHSARVHKPATRGGWSTGRTTGGTVNPISPPPAPAPAPAPTPAPTPPATTSSVTPPRPTRATSGTILEAGFETGTLAGWNTAGVGEVLPTVTNTLARTGSDSARFILTGNQNRSELILGGNGTASTQGTEEFFEGEEYWYGFSFYINQMVYGEPGAHNLIMQFKSNGTGSPEFGLQLWNWRGQKGLWTGGDAQHIGNSGERYLSPVTEKAWHDVQIHFRASEIGAGFYEVFFDGNLVDARTGVSMIVPGKGAAYIKDGLYRNGQTAPGTSEIFIDSAKLGTTQASVLP